MIRSRLLSVVTTFVLAATLPGCTTQTEGYCTTTADCPAGQRCNTAQNRCETPSPDGGLKDGVVDLVTDGPLHDGPVDDGPPTDSAKLPNGVFCSGDDVCQSGFCADGVCCDGRCDGLCRSCALAASKGTCTLASSNTDPDNDCLGTDAACSGTCGNQGQCAFPDSSTTCAAAACATGELTTSTCAGAGVCSASKQSCGGYACASASVCKTTCGVDGDCTGAFKCIGTQCAYPQANGAACGTNDKACSSGHCVDTVCCDTTCTGVCHACNLTGTVGTCSLKPENTACGATTCTGSTKTTPLCKTGACTGTPSSCGLYLCNTAKTDCFPSCSGDTQCVSTAYCGATACTAKKANGAACTATNQCTSTYCVANVCCNNSCSPAAACVDGASSSSTTLKSCATGTCATSTVPCALYRCNTAKTACLSTCTLDAQCVGTAYCDGTHCQPKLANGTTCAASKQCQSGICHATEKVCCDKTCATGPCESCKVTGKVGTCSFVPSPTPCNGGTIKCVNGATSSYLTKDQCTGSSAACTAVLNQNCGTYTCTTSGPACLTSCTAHSQCVAKLCDLSDMYATKNKCPSSTLICKASTLAAIQACINSGSKYVDVASGTYTGSLDVGSFDVQLVSTGTSGAVISTTNGLPVAGVAKVYLQGNISVPVLSISNRNVFVYGFDLSRSSGTGVLVNVAATAHTVELRSCHLRANAGGSCVTYNGGSTGRLYLRDTGLVSCSGDGINGYGPLTLESVGIESMTGHGVLHTGAQAPKDVLRLRDVRSHGNQGHGLFVVDVVLDWDRVRVTNNQGEGIRLENYTTTTTGHASNIEITDNGGYGLNSNFNMQALAFVNVTLANNGTDTRCSSSTYFSNSILTGDANCILDHCATSAVFTGGTLPYALLPGSPTNTPLIDGGDDGKLSTTSTLDAARRPRFVDKVAGGAKVDIGAYEVQ